MKINSRFAKVAVAAGLTVASGAAVLGLTGFASAQIAHNKSAAVMQAADQNTTDTVAAAPAADGSVAQQNVDPGAPPADANRPNPIAIAAKALGMTEADLVKELQAGKSIADVAKDKNVDLADVKAALLADLKAHLADEVKSGEHTQDEADAKLKEMESRLDQMLSRAGLPMRDGRGGPEGRRGDHGPARFATDGLAKVLNLTTDELNTQLRAGKSLADIATAQNVDIADVKAQLVTDFTAHLADEVKSGEHTQAEADTKLAEFTSRLDDMVNGVRPARGPEGAHAARGPEGDHDGRGHGPMGGQPGWAPGGDSHTTQSSHGSM